MGNSTSKRSNERREVRNRRSFNPNSTKKKKYYDSGNDIERSKKELPVYQNLYSQFVVNPNYEQSADAILQSTIYTKSQMQFTSHQGKRDLSPYDKNMRGKYIQSERGNSKTQLYKDSYQGYNSNSKEKTEPRQQPFNFRQQGIQTGKPQPQRVQESQRINNMNDYQKESRISNQRDKYSLSPYQSKSQQFKEKERPLNAEKRDLFPAKGAQTERIERGQTKQPERNYERGQDQTNFQQNVRQFSPDDVNYAIYKRKNERNPTFEQQLQAFSKPNNNFQESDDEIDDYTNYSISNSNSNSNKNYGDIDQNYFKQDKDQRRDQAEEEDDDQIEGDFEQYSEQIYELKQASHFMSQYSLIAGSLTLDKWLTKTTNITLNSDLFKMQEGQKNTSSSQRELALYLQFIGNLECSSIEDINFIQLAQIKKQKEEAKILSKIKKQNKQQSKQEHQGSSQKNNLEELEKYKASYHNQIQQYNSQASSSRERQIKPKEIELNDPFPKNLIIEAGMFSNVSSIISNQSQKEIPFEASYSRTPQNNNRKNHIQREVQVNQHYDAYLEKDYDQRDKYSQVSQIRDNSYVRQQQQQQQQQEQIKFKRDQDSTQDEQDKRSLSNPSNRGEIDFGNSHKKQKKMNEVNDISSFKEERSKFRSKESSINKQRDGSDQNSRELIKRETGNFLPNFNEQEKVILDYHPKKKKEINENFFQDIQKMEEEGQLRQLAEKKAEAHYEEEHRKQEIEDMLLASQKNDKRNGETNFQKERFKQDRIQELTKMYLTELQKQKNIRERADLYSESTQAQYQQNALKNLRDFKNQYKKPNQLQEANHSRDKYYHRQNRDKGNSGQYHQYSQREENLKDKYSPNRSKIRDQNEKLSNQNQDSTSRNISAKRYQQDSEDEDQIELKRRLLERRTKVKEKSIPPQNNDQIARNSVYASNFYKDSEQEIVNVIMSHHGFGGKNQTKLQKNKISKEIYDFDSNQEESNSGKEDQDVHPIKIDLQEFLKQKQQKQLNQQAQTHYDDSEQKKKNNHQSNRMNSPNQTRTNEMQQNLFQNQVPSTMQKRDKKNEQKQNNSQNSRNDTSRNKQEQHSSDSESESMLKSIANQVKDLQNRIQKDKQELDQSQISIPTAPASPLLNKSINQQKQAGTNQIKAQAKSPSASSPSLQQMQNDLFDRSSLPQKQKGSLNVQLKQLEPQNKEINNINQRNEKNESTSSKSSKVSAPIFNQAVSEFGEDSSIPQTPTSQLGRQNKAEIIQDNPKNNVGQLLKERKKQFLQKEEEEDQRAIQQQKFPQIIQGRVENNGSNNKIISTPYSRIEHSHISTPQSRQQKFEHNQIPEKRTILQSNASSSASSQYINPYKEKTAINQGNYQDSQTSSLQKINNYDVFSGKRLSELGHPAQLGYSFLQSERESHQYEESNSSKQNEPSQFQIPSKGIQEQSPQIKAYSLGSVNQKQQQQQKQEIINDNLSQNKLSLNSQGIIQHSLRSSGENQYTNQMEQQHASNYSNDSYDYKNVENVSQSNQDQKGRNDNENSNSTQKTIAQIPQQKQQHQQQQQQFSVTSSKQLSSKNISSSSLHSSEQKSETQSLEQSDAVNFFGPADSARSSSAFEFFGINSKKQSKQLKSQDSDDDYQIVGLGNKNELSSSQSSNKKQNLQFNRRPSEQSSMKQSDSSKFKMINSTHKSENKYGKSSKLTESKDIQSSQSAFDFTAFDSNQPNKQSSDEDEDNPAQIKINLKELHKH